MEKFKSPSRIRPLMAAAALGIMILSAAGNAAMTGRLTLAPGNTAAAPALLADSEPGQVVTMRDTVARASK